MADELIKVAAGISIIVEVRCPHCQNLNKYQPLTAVHSNVKNYLKKADADKPADWSADARCETCTKWFKIVKLLYM